MRVLFFARHFSYLRLFESAIAELAARGHHVHLVADREETMGGRRLAERLAERFPGVTLGTTPGRAPDAWVEFARRLRLGIDYLRYLDPSFADTPYLRARARARAPRSVVTIAERLGSTAGRARLGRVLRAVERGLPLNEPLHAFMQAQAPDVVLVTPLVELGSPQMEHLAAARALGLRTVLPVGSWDHLSSKALIRDSPDRVLVWNEVQRREAVEMHGLAPARVVVTGAQCYDQWFGRAPSRDHDAFCARVGLPAGRRFLLYLCSSLFRGTAREAEFVERWVAAVRGSRDPRLREAGILIRPHPARLDEWRSVDLSGFRDVALWGAHPVDDEAKDDYFDSLYHSAAVIGLNTSAFLEAAIAGKPVHTVLLDEISRDNQEGTLHFRYLLREEDGLLHPARSLDEHVAHLAAALDGPGGADARSVRFAEAFLRPHGLSEPATPRFADALEHLAAAPAPAPRGTGPAEWLARASMAPLVGALWLLMATQPHRKRARLAVRKALQDGRRRAFIRLKQFAQSQLGEKEAADAVPGLASALTPKPGRPRDPAKKLAGWNLPEAEAAREQVAALGRAGRPIVVGPWLSEAGFELLYWIPFVRWAKAHANLDGAQLIVVSRGGAASWYADITTQYEDVFSFYSPDEFRARNEARIAEQQGRLKHVAVSNFDRDIVARVAEKRRLRGVSLLHPSVMYGLFEAFWFQRVPVTLVEAFSSFARLPPVEPGELRRHLPDRYVAAKFYGNTALPDSPANRAFAASVIQELTQHTDVVLLNTGHRFDDHEDLPGPAARRLHRIESLMTPGTNLDVQTRVIAGAEGFVGTYGGFSYLAPLVGVNTLAFYSHATGFRFDHLELAKRVFSGLRGGTFLEVDTRAADLLRVAFRGEAGLAGVPEGAER